MITLGTTLRCNVPPRHIWVVLSDPARTNGVVLIVNMTTLTDDCVDDECVLGPDDYDLITHATTVAYSRHRIGPARDLEGLIMNGSFSVITPAPDAQPFIRSLKALNCRSRFPTRKRRCFHNLNNSGKKYFVQQSQI